MRIAAIVMLCGALGTAHADGNREQALQLFQEGRKLLLEANDPVAACAKFEASITLDPLAPGTMLNLGLCFFQQEKYASAIRWFRKAQAAAAEGGLALYQKAAEEHQAIIAPKLSTVRIEVVGVDTAEVRIDGELVRPHAYGRVEVDKGTREIDARAAGKKPVRLTVEVAEGDTDKPIRIEISEAVDMVEIDRGAARRTRGVLVATVGAVVLGAMIPYHYYEQSRASDSDEAKESALTRWRYIGSSMFVVGLGAIAVGGVLYFGAPAKENVPTGTAFTPVISPDQLGLSYGGRF